MKGSRVQNVVQELRGEKIDIIPWHLDAARYVCNALAPAEISRVIIDEENRSMEVIVPDEFLSVAIGKRGQNVRLASKLTGWHLDVSSETRYSEAMRTGYDSLIALPGVGISMADTLYEKGFYSAEELIKASIEDLTQIRGIGEEKAHKLIESAKSYVETQNAEDEATQAVAEEDTTDQVESEGQAAQAVAEDDDTAEPVEGDDEATQAVAENDDTTEPVEADDERPSDATQPENENSDIGDDQVDSKAMPKEPAED